MTDREMLIKAIEFCKNSTGCSGCLYERECLARSNAIEDDVLYFLREQEAVKPEWISVKDRLPERIGWYLVSLVNNRNGHRWKTPVVCEYSLDLWHENDMFLNDVDATVTHWMPLPKPPEEVSWNA